jgi:hypothetical protein
VDLRRCKALNVNRLLVSGLYPSPPRALSELTSVTARPIGAAATAFAFSPGQCQAGPDVPSGQLKHGAATPFGPSVYQSAGIQKAPPRRSALWPARVCNLERAPSATDISDKVYPAQPMHLSVVPSHLPPSPGGRVICVPFLDDTFGRGNSSSVTSSTDRPSSGGCSPDTPSAPSANGEDRHTALMTLMATNSFLGSVHSATARHSGQCQVGFLPDALCNLTSATARATDAAATAYASSLGQCKIEIEPSSAFGQLKREATTALGPSVYQSGVGVGKGHLSVAPSSLPPAPEGRVICPPCVGDDECSIPASGSTTWPSACVGAGREADAAGNSSSVTSSTDRPSSGGCSPDTPSAPSANGEDRHTALMTLMVTTSPQHAADAHLVGHTLPGTLEDMHDSIQQSSKSSAPLGVFLGTGCVPAMLLPLSPPLSPPGLNASSSCPMHATSSPTLSDASLWGQLVWLVWLYAEPIMRVFQVTTILATCMWAASMWAATLAHNLRGGFLMLAIFAVSYLLVRGFQGAHAAARIWVAACVLVPIAGLSSVLARPAATIDAEFDEHYRSRTYALLNCFALGAAHYAQSSLSLRVRLSLLIFVTGIYFLVFGIAVFRTGDFRWQHVLISNVLPIPAGFGTFHMIHEIQVHSSGASLSPSARSKGRANEVWGGTFLAV